MTNLRERFENGNFFTFEMLESLMKFSTKFPCCIARNREGLVRCGYVKTYMTETDLHKHCLECRELVLNNTRFYECGCVTVLTPKSQIIVKQCNLHKSPFHDVPIILRYTKGISIE